MACVPHPIFENMIALLLLSLVPFSVCGATQEERDRKTALFVYSNESSGSFVSCFIVVAAVAV